ncbi:MAG: hypothetical protein MJ094_07665 [Saccharofermentans sp.]|nr:hypothetical protein [Saccharofermentans sp.]
MATGFENHALIEKLPKEGVHCFPANESQVKTRRIVTVILMVVFAALAILFLVMQTKQIPMAVAAGVAFVITLLVFIQTFLIAKYRVAIDYNNKKVVLRYRYSLIDIPFETFDARDGEPDKAEEMLNNATNNGTKTEYLILDNVFDEACYQTSTKDLASNDDFFTLKKETFAIAEAYGARNSENAIKQNTSKKNNEAIKAKDLNEDDIDAIVEEASKEHEDSKKK